MVFRDQTVQALGKLSCIALLACSPAVSAQEARPTLRYPDGTPDLGPAPGEDGHWNTGVGNLSENFVEMDGAYLIHREDLDKVAPFQPWAKALVQFRLDSIGREDPHPRCKAPGGPRLWHTPGGVEIIQDQRHERIYVNLGGGSHSWREIYMDGREHPPVGEYDPSYFGHSVGRWENDVLIIDTVHFNERFWFARRPTGMVHTDALHLVERISRPDYETLHYEVTIDDPKAYTRPWTATWDISWSDEEMEEYFCQDYNVDLDHLVGAEPE